jgi:hypothetical protein
MNEIVAQCGLTVCVALWVLAIQQASPYSPPAARLILYLAGISEILLALALVCLRPTSPC